MKYLHVAQNNEVAEAVVTHLTNGQAVPREDGNRKMPIYDFNVQGQELVMTSVSESLLEYTYCDDNYNSWKIRCDPIKLLQEDVKIQTRVPKKYEKNPWANPLLAVRETLEREILDCSKLIIWTDDSRESENIGFEIIEICRQQKEDLKVERVTLPKRLTPEAIEQARNNITVPNELRGSAVNVRKEIDLRTGAAFTRLQSLSLQDAGIIGRYEPVPYGSCIIPALIFAVNSFRKSQQLTVDNLIQKLRENNIGTEATYDSHVQKIENCGYVSRAEESELLTPTPLGLGLIEGYEAMQTPFAEPDHRMQLEQDIHRISNGEIDAEDVLQDYMKSSLEIYMNMRANILCLNSCVQARTNPNNQNL